MQDCYRHPGVKTGLTCQRCGRPICGECAREADVGFQCPECRISTINNYQWRQKSTSRTTQPLTRRNLAGRMYAANSRPSFATSPVTFILIGITTVIFLVQLAAKTATGTDVLAQWGSFVGALSLAQPWRILTSAFLHAGFGHLIFNMLALYLFGQVLEVALGKARFLGLYLSAAVFGALGPMLMAIVNPSAGLTASLGASGAIFGLFGALFLVQRHIGASTMPLVILLVINFAYAFFVPNIAWEAHLAGLIGGAIMMKIYMVAGATSRPVKKQNAIDIVVTVVAIIIVAALIMGASYLFLGRYVGNVGVI